METPCLLSDLICRHAEENPRAPAILAPGMEPLTYGQLAALLHDTALTLNELGIRPGDRVAVVLPNGPEMATAFLAVSSVCTCAPLNGAYTEEEFRFDFQDLKVKAMIALPGREGRARQAAGTLGLPVFDLEPGTAAAGAFTLTGARGAADPSGVPLLAEPDQTALILHTSGTTARPKIVPLSHRNLFHSVSTIAATYSLTPADRCLNVMPLFHVHGLMASLGASLASGGSVVCAPGFRADQVLGWFQDLTPTWYTAVPSLHQAILEAARRDGASIRWPALRFIRSCSAALAPELAASLEQAFGAPVLEAYGMTEAAHQIASNPLPPGLRKFGSVGRATGSTRLSILDEGGQVLPPDTAGEVCIRGENVMSGYEDNPAANAVSFAGGWLRTGDRGVLDPEGYLFLQGRLKEIINRGGEKISPREVDEVLLRHPAVAQAVAFAIPHPNLGEDVAAAVVLREGCQVSLQELRVHAAASLANHKVPRRIVFVADIPKGPTGKVQRIGLAEKLKAELEVDNGRQASDSPGPATPLEAEIASIWQQVLGREPIGVSEDFLTLGGDSISAARILMLISERFQVDLEFSDVFSAPTVQVMAALVEERRQKVQKP